MKKKQKIAENSTVFWFLPKNKKVGKWRRHLEQSSDRFRIFLSQKMINSDNRSGYKGGTFATPWQIQGGAQPLPEISRQKMFPIL